MLKCKNEATMLLKTQDRAKKQSQNEATFRPNEPTFSAERNHPARRDRPAAKVQDP